MPKPTTIHEEVAEKYGKKPKLPSERIKELANNGAKRDDWHWSNTMAIIAYLDEEFEKNK